MGKSRGKKAVKPSPPKTAAAGCRELYAKAAQGPRIVQLLGAAFAQTQPTIVMEFCSRGTLDDAVRNWLDVAGARRVAAHVAEALAHLHSLRPAIVHRDVKPKNVLICRDGSAKLADFGLARPFPGRTANDQYVMTGETGTVRWMAPEAFRGDPYSLKVDIFVGHGRVVCVGRASALRGENFEGPAADAPECTTGLLSRAVPQIRGWRLC